MTRKRLILSCVMYFTDKHQYCHGSSHINESGDDTTDCRIFHYTKGGRLQNGIVIYVHSNPLSQCRVEVRLRVKCVKISFRFTIKVKVRLGAYINGKSIS